MVPQFDVEVDRIKTQTLHVTIDQVFSTLSSYLGSTYVNQFNKFGRTFQVYVQADAQFRLTRARHRKPDGAQRNGDMIPLGTLATITPAVGPVADQPLQSLSVGDDHRPAGAGLQLRPGDGADGGDRRQDPAARHRLRMDGDVVPGEGRRQPDLLVFGLALLLVYLVLAGQYESWYAPISVILAVPLSLLGPMAVLTGCGSTTISTPRSASILLIALSAKNAILIVEVARELHVRDGKPLLESAVEAARARFRPILMTSFAFILGVVPLVLATGAGASARKSIGITVFSRHDRLDLPRGAVRADVLCRGAAVRELAGERARTPTRQRSRRPVLSGIGPHLAGPERICRCRSRARRRRASTS